MLTIAMSEKQDRKGVTETEKKIISARKAGEILGVSSQMVRERMRSGAWKIGVVSKTENGYRYDVSVALLKKLMGE